MQTGHMNVRVQDEVCAQCAWKTLKSTQRIWLDNSTHLGCWDELLEALHHDVWVRLLQQTL